MDEEWYADRCRLRDLLREHPAWPNRELAAATGRSVGWVKKWKRRLREAPPDDEAVLWGRPSFRRQPPPTTSPAVVARILAIRDQPPADLRRVPGPKAILYFLHHDPDLAATGARLPRSTRSVWRVLVQHDRIARRPPQHHEPVDRPPPLTAWQVDFKDVTTVPADPDGKRQHAVETLNAVDTGTSLLVAAEVRADCTAETAVATLAGVLRRQGLPRSITLDRDPRFVGSATGRDFPAPFVRFLLCLGIAVEVNPPRRPDLNPFVERYNGTYERECLRVERPATLERAREVTAAFARHYNEERPNQALSCGNRPPRVAFPALPPLPGVPERVDPDRWLRTLHGKRYVRTVGRDGTVLVGDQRYYLKQALAGQRVALQVDAAARTLVVFHHRERVRDLPIKGLRGAELTFDDFVALMAREARAQWRRRPRQRQARTRAA